MLNESDKMAVMNLSRFVNLKGKLLENSLFLSPYPVPFSTQTGRKTFVCGLRETYLNSEKQREDKLVINRCEISSTFDSEN